jgi:hypothetical protein
VREALVVDPKFKFVTVLHDVQTVAVNCEGELEGALEPEGTRIRVIRVAYCLSS